MNGVAAIRTGRGRPLVPRHEVHNAHADARDDRAGVVDHDAPEVGGGGLTLREGAAHAGTHRDDEEERHGDPSETAAGRTGGVHWHSLVAPKGKRSVWIRS